MSASPQTQSALDDFREAINKSLSAEVGDLLKQRLEQADKDAQQVKELTTRLQQARDNALALIEDVRRLSAENSTLVQRSVDVEKKAAELAVKERELELAKLRADLALEAKNEYKEMFRTVFAPAVLREHVMKQVPVRTPDVPMYSNGNTVPGSGGERLEHVTETKIVTEGPY